MATAASGSHSARTEARLMAYRLMEGLQGDAAEHALEELERLRRRELSGWPEVECLAELGLAMAGVLRGSDPQGTLRNLDLLVERAEPMPALAAHALGLRAVQRVGNDPEAALSDLARSIALLDLPGLPALEACTALVVCAAACNALSLWELVDELYDRALALVPACEEPIQLAAIAVNRMLIRAEWATALVEQGQYAAAADQLLRAEDAAIAAATVTTLPPLWQADVAAGQTVLRLLIDPPADPSQLLADARTQLDALRAAGDVEMLPLAESLVAVALMHLDRHDEALDWLPVETAESTTTGARSFRLWLRARAGAKLVGDRGVPVIAAYDDYARTLVTQRLEARQALLAAARSRIAGERLRADRDRLSRDIELDPLTGLGNRRAFDGWLLGDLEACVPTAMLLIDLNGFKAVNDQHGHLAGDEVLRRIGQIIADRVRPTDRAIRLGGDEFAVLIEPAETGSSMDTLSAIAARRAHSLQSAIAGQHWDEIAAGLQVSASVGIAVRILEPHDDDGAARLYAEADRDLYARKMPARRELPAPGFS